jgi:sulfide:quinone oxidoreductase
MKRIVILGAGTAGTIMANRLRKLYGSDIKSGELQITIVDQDNQHVYQPGLLFVPFGIYEPHETVKPRRPQVSDGVEYHQAGIDRVEPEQDTVYLDDGRALRYDLLIVATGTNIAPQETEGLTGAGWRDTMHEFYTLEGATQLHEALERWDGGRMVVNIVEMPIKCPIAPLEFVFLADWYFHKKGMRDKVEIVLATPLDGAFTRPLAAKALGDLLEKKGIELVTDFNAGEADGENGRLKSWDERVEDFDLLVSIPLHMGADFVSRSPGLGDDMNFVLTDQATLQAKLKGRRDRWRTSRPRCWRGTSGVIWRVSRSKRGLTATPTASSRPASTRPCSSTSTTTSSRCPGSSRLPVWARSPC